MVSSSKEIKGGVEYHKITSAVSRLSSMLNARVSTSPTINKSYHPRFDGPNSATGVAHLVSGQDSANPSRPRAPGFTSHLAKASVTHL
ncbi:hypothetical protein HPB50_018914 [Hyalomma asiaticum]|uniref:Uncharacterized protein n=1 Tax=Hyalomma asiaticum TaxID=266040 RepID=A0ACB7TM76_HYAAI|nr:hypothetical protein HPB50_018914 [Hyalomma asiaticum]